VKSTLKDYYSCIL